MLLRPMDLRTVESRLFRLRVFRVFRENSGDRNAMFSRGGKEERRMEWSCRKIEAEGGRQGNYGAVNAERGGTGRGSDWCRRKTKMVKRAFRGQDIGAQCQTRSAFLRMNINTIRNPRILNIRVGLG